MAYSEYYQTKKIFLFSGKAQEEFSYIARWKLKII